MYSPSRTGVFELHPLTFIVTLLSKKQKCNLQSSDSRRICPDVMVMFPFSFSFFLCLRSVGSGSSGSEGEEAEESAERPRVEER